MKSFAYTVESRYLKAQGTEIFFLS